MGQCTKVTDKYITVCLLPELFAFLCPRSYFLQVCLYLAARAKHQTPCFQRNSEILNRNLNQLPCLQYKSLTKAARLKV